MKDLQSVSEWVKNLSHVLKILGLDRYEDRHGVHKEP